MATGAILGALAVSAGAFGAHGLKGRLTEQAMAWWNIAAQYQLVHSLSVVVAGLLARGSGAGTAATAGLLFVVGILVFSGTLYAMALGAPRWFGAITPLGGLALIAGWLTLAWAAWTISD